MSKIASRDRELGAVSERSAPSPDEVRRQLRNILASPAFHGSKRCHQFLEYVCEKALSGQAGLLKERTIAVEVFGRLPESDLAEDSIVRVGAREVRKRLAQYYVTPEGAASDVRIDVHPGSYTPEFRYAAAPHEKLAIPVALTIEEPRNMARRRNRGWILACASLALVALSAVSAMKLSPANPNAKSFQLFWDPVLRASDPMLLAVAHPIVYHPSRRALRLDAEGRPREDVLTQRPIQVPAKALDGSDMIAVQNQYVGFGDMVAASEVSAMLARKSKGVRLRLASSVGFEDLRNTQTFLIGAITNRWTMELQQAWRFRFARTPDKVVIADTQSGGREWSIPAKEDGSSPEDYILVCRIRNSFTGGLLLVAAGLKQFGTEAAGRLLADPDQLGVILRKLPLGWESKNLQFVLHAQVIGNAPALPEVVASHVW
jgi:hypothetical protein